MRRGLAIALAVLLLAAVALPLAEAGHGRGRHALTPREAAEEPSDEEDDAPRESETRAPAPKKSTAATKSPLSRLAKELDAVPAFLGIAALAMAGLAVLGVALMAARRAFRPPPPRLPKKSFAAGRAKGVKDGIRGSQAALAALENSGLGDLASVAPEGTGYRVILRRARGVPCEHAAGYLTGLFEAAWAIDVRLEHPACAGKDKKAPCVYEAFPAPPIPRRAVPHPATGRGRGGAGASTRG